MENKDSFLEAIRKITAKGNKAVIEQGRDGLKVVEEHRKVVWTEKHTAAQAK